MSGVDNARAPLAAAAGRCSSETRAQEPRQEFGKEGKETAVVGGRKEKLWSGKKWKNSHTLTLVSWIIQKKCVFCFMVLSEGDTRMWEKKENKPQDPSPLH